ncbi:molybdopterin-dependent oxidoreductase [Paraburkholderia sp. J11-2]|uniref:molybdopterin-dependent oxidoreductase n=1 Tax=Paraburkholderia sp. J11-2 TaxID=2805431 RepID=UPI002AB7D0FC|nr:molybdopterin-dependent oxidoreductase [Paraburkholderia sp. J11-2]
MGWPGWRRWAAVAGFALAGALLPFVQFAHAAQAAGSAGSAGSLSLDVDGEVRVTNNAAHTAYHFTEAQLLALPAHSITTATTWTPRSTFTGPLLSDVLKTVGAYGSQIEIHTLDDYTCVVPVADAARYGVVVAYEMNGQRLTVSNFGPLFLIYPRDQHPLELDGAAGDAKFAWQIKSMTIKR